MKNDGRYNFQKISAILNHKLLWYVFKFCKMSEETDNK